MKHKEDTDTGYIVITAICLNCKSKFNKFMNGICTRCGSKLIPYNDKL